MRRVKNNMLNSKIFKIFILLIILFIVSYLYFYFMDKYKNKENYIQDNSNDYKIVKDIKQCNEIPDYNPIIGPLETTPTKQICGCIWDNIDVDYNC